MPTSSSVADHTQCNIPAALRKLLSQLPASKILLHKAVSRPHDQCCCSGYTDSYELAQVEPEQRFGLAR